MKRICLLVAALLTLPAFATTVWGPMKYMSIRPAIKPDPLPFSFRIGSQAAVAKLSFPRVFPNRRMIAPDTYKVSSNLDAELQLSTTAIPREVSDEIITAELRPTDESFPRYDMSGDKIYVCKFALVPSTNLCIQAEDQSLERYLSLLTGSVGLDLILATESGKSISMGFRHVNDFRKFFSLPVPRQGLAARCARYLYRANVPVSLKLLPDRRSNLNQHAF